MDYSKLVRTQEGIGMREFFDLSMEDRIKYFNDSPDFHLDEIQDYHLIGLSHSTDTGELAFGRDRVFLIQYAEAELGLVYTVEVERCPNIISASKDNDEIRHTLGFKYFEGERIPVAIFMNHEYSKVKAFIELNHPKVEFEPEYMRLLAMKDLF